MKRLFFYSLLIFCGAFTITSTAQSSKFRLKVGTLNIPLKLVSPPTTYNGRIEVYLEDAVANLGKEFQLLDADAPMYGSQLIIYFLPTKREQGSNLISHTITLVKDAKIPEDILKTILEKLAPGDNITIQTVGTEGKILVNSAAIYIKDPSQPYRPPVYPSYNNDSDIFSWQIVGNLKKSLLKADTTVAANKKIVSMYSDKSKYDLMHIPGFQTKNRFIKAGDNFWPDNEISKTENFSSLKLKPYYTYPEYAVPQEYAVNMRWGKINASPLSQNIIAEQFKESCVSPIEIATPKDFIQLVQFEMIIVPDRGETTRYICDNITNPKIQEILSKVTNRSTIYLQNLMVKNEKSEFMFMPMVFGFVVSEAQK